jgi:RNA polymerase sigma-70 factor (ECF subfamily)
MDKYIHMMSRNIAVRWRDDLRREIMYRVKLIDHSPVRAPDHLLETKEFFLLVQNAVAKLPPRQRDVFQLLREEMKTHEEISKKLKISPNTVNNHIKKALVTLRACLIP